MSYSKWIKPKPRFQVLKWVKENVKKILRKEITIKDIFVCSICDAYQPLELRYEITRRVLEVLTQNGLPFTVLTKNANVLRDLDLFKSYQNCRVGFTVITLDRKLKDILEPYSSPIEDRCKALETLKREGVSTYCSIEPIMPCNESNPFEIILALKPYVNLFEFGKWSPYIKKGIPETILRNYSEQYYVGLFSKLLPFCKQQNIHYCIAVHSESFLTEHGFSFILHQLVTDRPYPDP